MHTHRRLQPRVARWQRLASSLPQLSCWLQVDKVPQVCLAAASLCRSGSRSVMGIWSADLSQRARVAAAAGGR